jgi:antirestriction protein
MIEAFVTNLGKYVGGELRGEWLKLPAQTEDVKDLFSRIGVDGVLYEEFFITDYNTQIDGLDRFGEYESIDELNYLAALLSDMDAGELEKFEAAAVYGDNGTSVKDLINLAQNLDCYDFYPDISDHDDLGRYLIEEMDCLEIPDAIVNYFDYEAYGRDFEINDGGGFVNGGYIMPNYGTYPEHYTDREDIPDEYRIFSYPDPPSKMPIREQLAMFGRMSAAHTAADRPAPAREDR